MNRRILPLTIVAVTLIAVFGLIHAIRLFAATTPVISPVAVVSANSSAGFTVEPLEQGHFTLASALSTFRVTVDNTGDALTDTYELLVESNWPVTLYGPDGATPLTDTNGTGDPDTGIVSKGTSFLITAEIETPSSAAIGDSNETLLTVRSYISPSLAMTAAMQGAVPAPFAQSHYQKSSRAMSLIMSQPDASWRAQTTADNWYGETTTFPNLAAAETFSGYVYLWTNLRFIDNIWRTELEYSLTNKAGDPLGNITKLTDHSQVTDSTMDDAPAVAVAPGGNIGVTWYRRIEASGSLQLYNVYLAILDPSGQPLTDTINLTDNSEWRASGTPGFDVPAFRAPRIAATGDEHFFVAWESSVLTHTEQVSDTHNLEDVYYAIYTTGGLSVTNPINLSNNIPGEPTRSIDPALVGVGADRSFISWAQQRLDITAESDIRYTVIDSANATVKSPAEMTDDPSPVDWFNSDLVVLSNGDILAAWLAYGCPGYEDYGWNPRIRYALFKSGNYNRAAPPECLSSTVVAKGGDSGVSLAADNLGRIILTWTDRNATDRSKLYYTLLKANGKALTDPMIFYQSKPGETSLSTGLQGYASASRIFLDAAIDIDPPAAKGISADPIPFTIGYEGLGAVTGTGVVVTLSLAPSLSYHADNSSSTPTIDGQEVSWNLPDLLPWSQDAFEVQITVSNGATLLAGYPLTVTIAVDGREATMTNNIAQADVIVNRSIYLATILGE